MKKLLGDVVIAIVAIVLGSMALKTLGGERVIVEPNVPIYNSKMEHTDGNNVLVNDAGNLRVLNENEWGYLVRLKEGRKVWLMKTDVTSVGTATGPKEDSELTKTWKFVAPVLPLAVWGLLVGLLWYYIVQVSPAERLEKLVEITWKTGTGAKVPLVVRAHRDPDPMLAQKAAATGVGDVMDLIMDQAITEMTALASALQPWESGSLNRSASAVNRKLLEWRRSGLSHYTIEAFVSIRDDLGLVTDTITVAGTIDQDAASTTLIEAHAGSEAALSVLKQFSEITGEEITTEMTGKLEALIRSQAWQTFARAASEFVGDVDLNKLADLLAARKQQTLSVSDLKPLIASVVKK